MDDTPQNFTGVPDDVMRRYASLLEKAKDVETGERGRTGFLDFIRIVWPDFIAGNHHRIMAEKFERIARGELKRLIVNMPPRHTKSEFASVHMPAWMMGLNPKLKIIQATHTGELAVHFGRRARNLMDTAPYKSVFPDAKVRPDAAAAGRWMTTDGGEYFAAGVGGAITGRGADLLIIDDPHSEQDALSVGAFDAAWDWYTSGPRQRLQPGGVIVIVQTRWSLTDLTARVLEQQMKDPLADQWEIVEFPAILDEHTDHEKAIWPEFWKLKEIQRVRASLSVGKWQAQWQQQPTSDSSSILKRHWWKKYTVRDQSGELVIPHCDYVLQSYDTAYGKQETADYSAITTWGVFHPDEGEPPNILLLAARRGRWDFPDLKRVAFEQYEYWQPDCVLIESKATGAPLSDELRATGIPVTNYAPSRGNDKFARVNSVSPVLESGVVWAPDTQWADEVIEECAAFPVGKNDDYVDTVTAALRRFREGGFVSLGTDWGYGDEDDYRRPMRPYY